MENIVKSNLRKSETILWQGAPEPFPLIEQGNRLSVLRLWAITVVFAAGMIAFMLCTCHELPQTVFAFFHGGATMAELAASLAMGLWGVAGLVCAWYATGEGLHLLPDHMYSRKK